MADLSTEAFLGSLKHFAALHGAPTKIYSDNGSNFKGADSELKKLCDHLESTSAQEQLQHWAFTWSCEWHTSPSRAPHFGGHKQTDISRGDIVLLKEDAIFQRFWPMARVVKTYPRTDGLVQAVDITMNGKILRIPIHKLVKLLGEDQGIPVRGRMYRSQRNHLTACP